MQTTLAAGYLPPSDLEIQAAADAAGLSIKAPEFIRDVCNIRANGRFVTAEELNAVINKELQRHPIKQSGDRSQPFIRTDNKHTYKSYGEAAASFRQDHQQLANQIRAAIDMLPSMDIPGGSPMTQAVNLLRVLAAQQGENEDNSSQNENEILRKLLKPRNLNQAKEAVKQARQLTPKEQELLKNLTDIKKGNGKNQGQGQGQGGKEPNPSNKGQRQTSSGMGGDGISDGKLTGHTANSKSIIDSAINLADKQLSEVVRISRKLKSFSKLRTSKIQQFKPDVEGTEVRNRAMKTFDEIARLKGAQFSQMSSAPKLFNYRAVTNQYLVRERGKYVEKKQLLYVLVDCSGSMSTRDKRRINMAAGILVNRLMAVMEGDASLYWRFFDTMSYEATFVDSKDQAKESILKVLQEEHYDGGGTNFDVAINDAVTHIESLKDSMEFAKPEIFMVTDGGCHCHLTPAQLKGVKLHAAIVAGEGSPTLERLVGSVGGAFMNFV